MPPWPGTRVASILNLWAASQGDSSNLCRTRTLCSPGPLTVSCPAARSVGSAHKSSDQADLPAYYNPLQQDIDFGDIGALDGLDMPPQALDLGIPAQYRTNDNTLPWHANNLRKGDESCLSTSFIPSDASQPSPTNSGHLPSSPVSPSVKFESAPSPLRRIQGKNSKIEKKKAEPANKFVIMTPTIINASAGKPNPFECFEAMRTTQKGRKGPLANEIKENALQVRRLGACFCCHARKVKVLRPMPTPHGDYSIC